MQKKQDITLLKWKHKLSSVWINTFLLLLVQCLFAVPTRAEIKLPAIFGDNMVLQQQAEVALWGWAGAGSRVEVKTSWDKQTYTAVSSERGFWKLYIQTPQASHTACTLTISDGQSLTLKNILIGEVWLCSGQSNMTMPMKGFENQPVEGSEEAIARSDNPAIRYFSVKRAVNLKPQLNCEGSWEIASKETVPEFSATAYFFGRYINRTLNVPVGLIHASWGGSIIEAWMTPASLQDIPGKTVPAVEKDIRRAKQKTPVVLYNGMIHPIAGYGMKGAIWYQGESNKNEPDVYVKMFANLVHEWRKLWGIGDFPFYFCQIAPYNYGNGLPACYIREAQAKGMQIPNTGMAVLMDAGDPQCIHPPKKKEAGERLAFWALARTYGIDTIPCRSPEFKSLEQEGATAIVTFNTFGSAAGLTSHGKEIRNFQIAGENRQFYQAQARLESGKVYLSSPQVDRPVAVRYCFDDASPAELFSIEGNLPVSSFRSDNE
jgi:sialate O-acetylesterase